MDFHLQTFFPILIFLVVVVGFAAGNMLITHAPFLKPKKKTPVKQMPYESGMDPIGDARQHFDVRFYLVAILFLVFDVELLFLYPWAVLTYGPPPAEGSDPAAPGLLPTVFKEPIFWEMLAFLVILAVAYVYAWRKGVFKWR
jgi:NADH:ubiquinone oxidoreductase subunit 3 (subunit A)